MRWNTNSTGCLLLLFLPLGLFYKPIIHKMWHFTIFLRAVDKGLAYINDLFSPGIAQEEGPSGGLECMGEKDISHKEK